MERTLDNAPYHDGSCRLCGTEISWQDVTKEQADANATRVNRNGGLCDRCVEGETPFVDQVDYQIVVYLGPTPKRELVESLFEPQDASYVVVRLKDGRLANIYRKGESHRELPEEVDFVFRTEFPDLKKTDQKWNT